LLFVKLKACFMILRAKSAFVVLRAVARLAAITAAIARRWMYYVRTVSAYLPQLR